MTGWLTAPDVAGDQGDDVSPTLCVGGQSGEGEQRDSDVRPGTRDQRAELSWLAHTCRPKYRPRAESWAQMGCWVYSESPAPGYWHLTSVCSVQLQDKCLTSIRCPACLATPFMDDRIGFKTYNAAELDNPKDCTILALRMYFNLDKTKTIKFLN